MTWYIPLLLAQVLDVGSAKQLFIDHRFFEMVEGVTLTVNPARATGEKVLVPDAPWEKDAKLGSYCTVVDEGGKVRMWYHLLAGVPEPGKNPPLMGVGYAESTDGVHFTKPRLGLVEWNGSKDNNLVMPHDLNLLTVGGGSVWRDDNPACPPERRYKSWCKVYPKPGSGLKGPHRVWYSADGLKWFLDERRVTGLRAADTQPSWFWDPRVKRYVGYSREWVREKAGFGARMASYNESDDLINWDSMTMALEPDERDMAAMPPLFINPARMQVRGEDILPVRGERREGDKVGDDQVLTPTSPVDFYGPGVFPYHGVYVAMIPVFYHWSGSGVNTMPSTSDIQLAVSRDGRHFSRPGGRVPFIRTGAAGAFDSKWIYPILRPVERNGELSLYYFGTNHNHASKVDPAAVKEEAAVTRATLRLDGFVSADAAYEGGWFLTPAIRFNGSRLELNIDTGAGGWARIELLDETGKPLPGYTIDVADELNINSTRAVASWGGKSDLSGLAGKAIRMRVKMRATKLYAFQFR